MVLLIPSHTNNLCHKALVTNIRSKDVQRIQKLYHKKHNLECNTLPGNFWMGKHELKIHLSGRKSVFFNHFIQLNI
ncbi:hypothetical protein KY284_010545 [Solanum tuberosum]|nr:hypothetical protein KY284_010545 [Solanum tuberosum]